MEANTKFSHGTDSLSYRISERIRLGHNRFLLRLLSQMRGEKAFESSDRVLDIGCGDFTYFSKLWTKVAPEFGTPGFVQGIDKAEITGKESLHLPSNLSLKECDFFDLRDGEWDLVYSSFCHAWLRIPRSPSETENMRDEAIVNKLNRLIKPGGWFAAHYPGERDYFPYYNRLIIAALNRIGHPLGNKEAYFAYRDTQIRVPDLIEDTRKRFQAGGFRNHLLIKTIEWIPLRRDQEFLAYWESGGKKLLLGQMDENTYASFKAEMEHIISTPSELLKTYGMETLSQGKFVLLPTYHIYHIAQRSVGQQPMSSNRGSTTSYKDHTHLLIRGFSTQQKTDDKRRVEMLSHEIETVFKEKNRKLIYLATIEAGGAKREVSDSFFTKPFENRQSIVARGSKLSLPTITNIILESENHDEASPTVGVFSNITDDQRCLSRLRIPNDANDNNSELIEVINFLWPDGFLRSLVKERTSSEENDLGVIEELSCGWIMTDNWPRLIVVTDKAFSLARRMESDDNATSSKLTGPLHYFLWQSRVGCPEPCSFIVLPQRLERRGSDGSHTSFLMWQCKDQSMCRTTFVERVLILAMQPLALYEVALQAEDIGEGIARVAGHAAMAHEMEKVVAAIAFSTPSWILREVRYYFQILVQDRRQIVREEAFSLWTNIVEMCPVNFVTGKTLDEFLKNHAIIAMRINHVAHLIFRGGLTTAKDEPTFSADSYELSCIENPPSNPDFCAISSDVPPRKLDVALPLAAALVCLFRNIEQHRQINTKVLIKPHIKEALLEVINTGPNGKPQEGGSKDALMYYITQYAPGRANMLFFPDKQGEDGRWHTILPLPEGFYATS